MVPTEQRLPTVQMAQMALLEQITAPKQLPMALHAIHTARQGAMKDKRALSRVQHSHAPLLARRQLMRSATILHAPKGLHVLVFRVMEALQNVASSAFRILTAPMDVVAPYP
jgi:hypothetical protein